MSLISAKPTESIDVFFFPPQQNSWSSSRMNKNSGIKYPISLEAEIMLKYCYILK